MAENCALIPEPVTMYTNKDSLKDVKDLSKNLMSGEFERQYTGSDGRRRKGCVILGVTVGCLGVWLLVLTVVREIQLSSLRQEVDQLSANMIAMSANVMSLNQKLSNNRLFNEFKTLEDTIYADEDQDSNLIDEKKDKTTQNDESLDKLRGLTVLEDDSQLGDDEDLYDGDEDAESGDWYPDYDRRREKVGTANMVRLKPEDFTDTVVARDISKLKDLLNKDPETPDLLPAMAAPSTEASRKRRSLFSDSTPENDFVPPRSAAKLEGRRKTKKFFPSESTSKIATHPVSRTARNSNDEERRPFIAAHFHGNTSHLSTKLHEHFKGNGLVNLSYGAAHNVWYPAGWTRTLPLPRPALTQNGHVHVYHTGVYFVYVQIYYLDCHDVISWVLHRTGSSSEGRDTLLQCAQSAHSSERLAKPNSCFSAAALFLRAGDRLAVRNTGGGIHSLMQPEKSFIGLIKLADADEPDFEF